MANSLKNHIENLLKSDERLIDENNEIRGSLIRELANKLDEKLIELLLNDEKARNSFFLKINEVYVFKHNDFKFFLDENKIDNSYTQYENRIGLAVGSKMLNDNQDVVLNFPYKDCVLEGGQSTEEGMDTYFEYSDEKAEYEEKQSKRKEIFFNEVLARDEIDRLFEPKAFTNIKKYSQKGVEIPTTFTRNENGFIKENLIVKGNNLLALHSLKKQFKGQVNLIYIDPPFNTGNDTFKYNDKFNHSSWLSFMKNRLNVANELLKDSGNIFIHIDINETHYLKVLCDDIFGKENFVEEIIWAYGSPSGGRAAGAKPVNIHDTILHYSKCYSARKQFRTYIPYSEKYIKEWFKYFDDDGRQYRRRMRDNDSNGNSQWEKQYLDESKGMPLSTVWTDIKQVYADPRAYKDNQSHSTELLKGFSGGQKPEELIKRIIEMTTEESDIVLDYHLGTGTTVAAAHKLKRQYIGIEQMDYIETFTCKRLEKIIGGNATGISKSVNWKGGSSFVYLELAKNNEQAKELILDCESFQELVSLFDALYEEFFLHYNVKITDFKEKICKEENFIKLPLLKQKEMFCKMLDLNQMFVNASEMEDSRYKLSTSDISLTKDFYQIKD